MNRCHAFLVILLVTFNKKMWINNEKLSMNTQLVFFWKHLFRCGFLLGFLKSQHNLQKDLITLSSFKKTSLQVFFKNNLKKNYFKEHLLTIRPYPQGPGPWAQLIKWAQCIKIIDELHVAISFSKPKKLKINISSR